LPFQNLLVLFVAIRKWSSGGFHFKVVANNGIASLGGVGNGWLEIDSKD
jgi:hypothetical protein